ncbi:gamma-glutamyl-gamma-aminobutyrate hydrolase family protein, partial [Mycobacterium intracellulare subsp. chimaera]|nr:gamma-glutamyl-gamma-aminobutyrate hydrolase family protein [Mycobacterium intracellulare subsp. chimaera]
MRPATAYSGDPLRPATAYSGDPLRPATPRLRSPRPRSRSP